MLGLKKGIVELVEFSESWNVEFSNESALIQDLIGDRISGIHHIGSTAVPGLISKPIIDIAIELSHFQEGFSCIEGLSSIGYRHQLIDELPERHYWSKGDPRTHQIHMFSPKSVYLKNALLFKEKLIKNDELRNQYINLKLKLKFDHGNDKHEYAMSKSSFIDNALRG